MVTPTNDTSHELSIGLQWGTPHRNIGSSERRIDIREAGAVWPPSNDFARLIESADMYRGLIV